MVKYAITAVFFIVFLSCDSSTGIVPPVLPHSPVNQGWKAVDNLEHAFNQRDLSLLEETLDPSFVFDLPEEDWDDYDGDGVINTTLTRELYLTTVSTLFEEYQTVELELQGSEEGTWPGDPTGSTMQYPRTYLMKVSGGQQQGWVRSGETVIRCKPDTAGIWFVTGMDETS